MSINTTISTNLPISTVVSICDLNINAGDIDYGFPGNSYTLSYNYKQQIADCSNIMSHTSTNQTNFPTQECKDKVILILSKCSKALNEHLNLDNNNDWTRNIAHYWDDWNNRPAPWLYLTDLIIKINYLLLVLVKTYDSSSNYITYNTNFNKYLTAVNNVDRNTRGISLFLIKARFDECTVIIAEITAIISAKSFQNFGSMSGSTTGSCPTPPTIAAGLTSEQIAANLKAAKDASDAAAAVKKAANELAVSEHNASCSSLVDNATAAEKQLSSTALQTEKVNAGIDLANAVNKQAYQDEANKRDELHKLSVRDQTRQDNAVAQMQITTTAIDASNNNAYISTITKFSHFLELSQKYNDIALQNKTVDKQIKQDEAVYSTDNQLINFKSEQIDYLKRVNYILFCGFYLLIIGFILVMFFYPNKLPNLYFNIVMIALLCLFPFFINMIERYVLNTFLYLYSLINGSVYVPSGIPEPPPPPQTPITPSDTNQYIH